MKHKSLNDFVNKLETLGQLKRISQEVSPMLEISEIADRVVKNNGQALLFENNGTKFPLLINAFSSDERLKITLNNKTPDEIGKEIENFMHLLTQKPKGIISKLKMLPKLKQIASWMPSQYKGKAPCQEVILNDPNLNILPILKCWPFDGGRFITLPVVHTLDPETNERNVGMYRMQIFDSKTTGMHWHMHKDSASHFQKYKELGKMMPVAVALGGDLIYTYAATAPLPENIDEYFFAGFLRKEKVRLTTCVTQPIEVPIDADIVIEGYVDPNEDLVLEGPFGDHTGFYSLADYYPKFHVTCITHRKNAIYPATIVGVPPMEDAWLGKATERIFLAPIKMTVSPDIIDLHMPTEGIFHNLVLVKIKNKYPGLAFKVMNALWGAGQMMFSKIIVVLDEDVDIHNYNEVMDEILENVVWEEDTQINKGPADVLDHASRKFAYHGKVGVDATNKRKTNPVAKKEIAIEEEFAGFSVFDHYRLVENKSIAIVTVSSNVELDELSALISGSSEIIVPKLIVIVDTEILNFEFRNIAWLVMNNIDPIYDLKIIEFKGTLLIDGRSKNNMSKVFNRKWPNVIVSDNETINKIDQIWDTLELGDFIQSPSINFKKLVTNEGAEKR